MKRLKIAFVVDRFGNRYGGAESYGVALMRELSNQHDITVLASDYDPSCDLVLNYIPLGVSRRWPNWIRVLVTAIRARRLTRRGYDIVHSHSNGWAGDIEVVHVTPVRYNWRVRSLPFLKWLTSYISPRVQTYLSLEARRVAPRKGHHTVAVSSLIAQQLQQAYGPGLRAPVIPPGVYLPDSDVNGLRESTRQALELVDGDCVWILVARNPLRKGLKTALEALARLPAHHKLVVVGSNASTDRAVQGLPGFETIADRVRLVHATSNVEPYYRAADICVHPTLNDSFGMAPLEAMSFGLPVILSSAPWCGFAAYLQDGRDALLLNDPADAGNLAALIDKLTNDDALQHVLRDGAARIVSRHAWPAIAERYCELYRDVLAQRNAQVIN